MAKCIVCYTDAATSTKMVKQVDKIVQRSRIDGTYKSCEVLAVKKLCPHYKDGKLDYYIKTQLYVKEQ